MEAALLVVGVLVAANFAGDVTHSRRVFWTAAVAWLWILLPASAAANTFYSLRFVEQERAQSVALSGPQAPLF